MLSGFSWRRICTPNASRLRHSSNHVYQFPVDMHIEKHRVRRWITVRVSIWDRVNALSECVSWSSSCSSSFWNWCLTAAAKTCLTDTMRGEIAHLHSNQVASPWIRASVKLETDWFQAVLNSRGASLMSISYCAWSISHRISDGVFLGL